MSSWRAGNKRRSVSKFFPKARDPAPMKVIFTTIMILIQIDFYNFLLAQIREKMMKEVLMIALNTYGFF